MAVAHAAIDSGVARHPINDWVEYESHLDDIMGYSNKVIRQLYSLAKQTPKRVVFCEGNHVNMIKAAMEAKREGICYPILLGSEDRIRRIADENGLALNGMQIIDHRSPLEDVRRTRYAQNLSRKKNRQGIRFQEAFERMSDRNYFGMMMVETGDADAVITGVYSQYSEFARAATEVIGIREGYDHFASMNIIQTKKGLFFLADTLINRWPDTEALKDITKLTDEMVRFFNTDPVIAMLSFSNFGTESDGSPKSISEVVKYFHDNYPDMKIDGEMQVNFALNKDMRDKAFPFNKIKGEDVNTLVFPNLSSANISSKLLMEFGIDGESIGPIQMGLRKAAHFTDIESSVRDIVNLTAVAVVDAIAKSQKSKLE